MTAAQLDRRLPMIAILRGIEAHNAADVGMALASAGFEIVEVTMNSPEPLKCIERIADAIGDRVLVGAGTVMSVDQVADVAAAGGNLIISPNFNANVVAYTASRGMVSLPGVFTPSEMLAALDAGATGLKIFPAEAFPASAVKAVRSVLPPTTHMFVVGGISASTMGDYIAAGATGFGIGGSIFKPGKSLSSTESDARAILMEFTRLRSAR